MRRLGEELGFEAMSLYRHVAKQAGPARRDARPRARRMAAPGRRGGLGRGHPCERGLRARRPPPSPLGGEAPDDGKSHPSGPDPVHGRAAAQAARRRLRCRSTYHVYHLLDGFIFGFSLWEIAYTTVPLDADAVSRLMQSIPWDDHPHLAAHRDQHMEEGPHRDVSAFDLGLDLILAGLEQTLGSA